MSSRPVVIAHRGASGYLPEHSLPAKALAYAMGADFLEQDLVMTQDDQIVVLHDHYLDRVTNVADIYPDRCRNDGRYYAIDFTLAEIKQLEMTERFDVVDGQRVPVYRDRFPIWTSTFRVSTLQEELELIQGLNKSTGKHVGIYPELKAPWLHRQAGKDFSRATLQVLKAYGYTSKACNIYLQCFDPHELQRIKFELLPALDMDLKLIQLMAETSWQETKVVEEGQLVPYDYDWLFQAGAMAQVATYADGIGPHMGMIVQPESTAKNLRLTPLVQDAHAAGLAVHPYTFRLDSGTLPSYATSFEQLLDIFLNQIGVDGIFTDFPDRAVDFLNTQLT
ncbi:MAG: glycerophosphodiester phosphodiesterase [Cyanobacteria bacterium P01_H01_bin.121]